MGNESRESERRETVDESKRKPDRGKESVMGKRYDKKAETDSAEGFISTN